MFADDTSIFIYNTNHEELNLNFKLDLIQISKWFQANQLTLNQEKTSLVKFAPTKSFLYPPNLSYMGQIFIELNNIKFLDLQLDSHLTWKMHVNYLFNKQSVNVIYNGKACSYITYRNKMLYILLIFIP
jgi:hypothetical protein